MQVDQDLIYFVQVRAAETDWPVPETPEEILAWLLDEAKIQEEQHEAHPEEPGRAEFAARLRENAARLTGVTPAHLPWEV